MTTWLVLDTNCLAYRALYTMERQGIQDMTVGIVHGVLTEAQAVMEWLNTRDVVWCFDLGRVKRLDHYPNYKRKRKRKAREDMPADKRDAFQQAVSNLRRLWLPRVGFRNVLHQVGYESDDMMAVFVATLPRGDEAILVTRDQDMFQCIRPNVRFWDPQTKKFRTYQSFHKEWGIEPKDWWRVKAIAGCATDEVPGIPGVGEKTAVKYLRGELPVGVKYRAIKAGWDRIVRRNIRLVRLPYPGTLRPIIREDKVNPGRWRKVLAAVGPGRKRRKGLSDGQGR